MLGAVRRSLALLPLLIFAARGADLEDAARQLARTADSLLQPREPVAIATQNLSSLSSRDLLLARRRFEVTLRESGHRPAPGGTEIRLTLAENLASLILAAEVKRDNDRAVRLVSIPKPESGTEGRRTMRMTLSRELLVERPDPVLDVAVRAGLMLVLEDSRVTLTSAAGTTAAPLGPEVKPQRDPRGRLRFDGSGFRAWLPGVSCEGRLEPLEIQCQAPGAPWPLVWGPVTAEAAAVADRNWFESPLLTAAGRLAAPSAFYAAALAGDRDNPAWILALTGGQKQIYGRAFQTRRAIPGFGSDIASLESGCGRGRQVLMTRPAGPDDTDSVQAFELVDDRPVAVSDPVEMSGPVTALWPEESGQSAIAVARGAKTGAYEAYRLAVVCGR